MAESSSPAVTTDITDGNTGLKEKLVAKDREIAFLREQLAKQGNKGSEDVDMKTSGDSSDDEEKDLDGSSSKDRKKGSKSEMEVLNTSFHETSLHETNIMGNKDPGVSQSTLRKKANDFMKENHVANNFKRIVTRLIAERDPHVVKLLNGDMNEESKQSLLRYLEKRSSAMLPSTGFPTRKFPQGPRKNIIGVTDGATQGETTLDKQYSAELAERYGDTSVVTQPGYSPQYNIGGVPGMNSNTSPLKSLASRQEALKRGRPQSNNVLVNLQEGNRHRKSPESSGLSIQTPVKPLSGVQQQSPRTPSTPSTSNGNSLPTGSPQTQVRPTAEELRRRLAKFGNQNIAANLDAFRRYSNPVLSGNAPQLQQNGLANSLLNGTGGLMSSMNAGVLNTLTPGIGMNLQQNGNATPFGNMGFMGSLPSGNPLSTVAGQMNPSALNNGGLNSMNNANGLLGGLNNMNRLNMMNLNRAQGLGMQGVQPFQGMNNFASPVNPQANMFQAGLPNAMSVNQLGAMSVNNLGRIGANGVGKQFMTPSWLSPQSSLNTSGEFDSEAFDEEDGGKGPRRWTEEEDLLLQKSVEKNGARNWKKIAEMVPGRNHVQCLQRWKKALDPNVVKGHWSPEEDEILLKLMEENPKNWGHVARGIPGRTAKQCRERYHNHLDPNIKKGDWSLEEDILILKRQKLVGNKWADIAKLLPGRTENSVKIRWKSIKRQVLGLQEEQNLLLNNNGTEGEPKKRKAKRSTMEHDRLLKLLDVWKEINAETKDSVDAETMENKEEK